MPPISRRNFLRSSAIAAGATLAARPAAAAGANERIRLAVIGVHGQGQAHMDGFSARPDVQVAALCDVDEKVLNAQADALEKKAGHKVARFGDLRKLFEDKSIDAVSIATPNHWHTLAALWAMQAGKDVYVEKPLSHEVWEGRQLVKAARKYNRMCQHGTQGRSCPAIEEAMAKLREGVIGEVYMARALCYKWRPSIGTVDGPQPVPKEVNYDLWLGPAPQKPPLRKQFHYDWHWFWDYGNGDIGNQGVHEMDMARWGLGVGLPGQVQSTGGRFLFKDAKETFNVQTTTFFYPEQNKMLVFDVRPWITNHEGDFGSGESNDVGVIFYGSEGYMTVEYFGYKTFLGRKRQPGPARKSGENRWERFAKAVRSRKREDLGVDVEDGHLTSALCHLANIAARLQRTITFDPATEQCPRDTEANALLRRAYRPGFEVPEEV